MSYEIKYDDVAVKQIKNLDKSIKIKIDKEISKLAKSDNPKAFAKPLQHDLKGSFRLMVGGFRIIVEIDDKNKIIRVKVVGNRDKIYKKEDFESVFKLIL